ncbi:hypothetical protein E2C01_004017 [Portunus trituberculatus]|uniref:Uncharacterized protein n=1 Tax=Portunus trituberculatus TaxID=210409 RepID=A0A5B7CSQ2_PORTR|nr:hypothetical protein [Portunus trituberculatus]
MLVRSKTLRPARLASGEGRPRPVCCEHCAGPPPEGGKGEERWRTSGWWTGLGGGEAERNSDSPASQGEGRGEGRREQER